MLSTANKSITRKTPTTKRARVSRGLKLKKYAKTLVVNYEKRPVIPKRLKAS
jgi:prolyl-tRNA editing enzyme YbaK/EbsC (Cys-tRNA(Pro) deacylase)